MKFSLTRKLLVTLLTTIILISLTGCNKKEQAELDIYQANMTQFFENIGYLSDTIDAIDPLSENADDELLSLLDQAAVSFSQMAALEVPETFAAVSDLADEADAYMTEAVNLYHQFYEAEQPDENIFAAAQENNARANLRLQYITAILRGEDPTTIKSDSETIATE